MSGKLRIVMRRLDVVLREDAALDLQRIYDAVAEKSQSLTVARGFVDRILARCQKIGDAPRGGRPRNDLKQGLRTVPFESRALIVYRVSEVVEIVNIFPRGFDYDAFFREQV